MYKALCKHPFCQSMNLYSDPYSLFCVCPAWWMAPYHVSLPCGTCCVLACFLLAVSWVLKDHNFLSSGQFVKLPKRFCLVALEPHELVPSCIASATQWQWFSAIEDVDAFPQGGRSKIKCFWISLFRDAAIVLTLKFSLEVAMLHHLKKAFTLFIDVLKGLMSIRDQN